MPDQKSETINEITGQNIHPTVQVVTDNFSSYKRLDEVVKKHVAKTVPPAEGGKELPRVHIAISNAKRNLLNKFHHFTDTYLQTYLDEFTFKLNRRYFGEGLFDRLVIACICFSWTLY